MTEINVRVLIMGSSSAGKTCLWNRLALKECPYEEDWQRYVYRDHAMEIVDANRNYKLVLHDTAAETENAPLVRRLFYLTTDGVIMLCFSLDSRESYQQLLDKYLPELKIYDYCRAIVLVGTKTDLERKITRTELEFLIKKVKPRYYLECSPLKGTGRKAILDAIINTYRGKVADDSNNKRKCILM